MFIYPDATSFDSVFNYEVFYVFQIAYLSDKHKLPPPVTITVHPTPKKPIIFFPKNLRVSFFSRSTFEVIPHLLSLITWFPCP